MKHEEDGFFLSEKASKARLREAENARKNRAEIVKAYSQGKVTRRELVKWGLITTGGLLAPIHGLNPFVNSAYGAVAPARPPSATPRQRWQRNSHRRATQPEISVCSHFSAPMPRFDVIPRGTNPLGGDLTPVPQAQANQTQQPVDPALGGGTGPIEGRPPGPIWAHQRFGQFTPQISIEMSQAQATTNTVYNPGVASQFNSGINPATPDPAEVPSRIPDARSQFGVDLQRHDSAEVGHCPLRRAAFVPPPQPLACGRYAEQRLWPEHHLHPRAQRTPRRGERRLSPERSSSPTSSMTITGRSCWPGTSASTPAPLILGPAALPTTAGSTTSPVTGMRPCPRTGSTITCSALPRRTCTRATLRCSTSTARSIVAMSPSMTA